MIRLLTGGIAVGALALHSSTAIAGIYSDDLSKCVVQASTQEDKAALVQWMFSTLSLNPAVKPLSTITADQRTAITQKTDAIMERLMTSDCRAQAIAAYKYEGPAIAMQTSFQVLGQVAARGLMSDPTVVSGMQELQKYSDRTKWEGLYKEAGLPIPEAPAAKPSQ